MSEILWHAVQKVLRLALKVVVSGQILTFNSKIVNVGMKHRQDAA